MKKIIISCLLLFCPALVLAAESLTFAPPATDYSVVFLGNIFGVVDGVLHGSGSQIMGSMFGVFNAAVLAIGGLIIMYTLIVGTMNTAHKGQIMGGERWSSIWIPLRSTAGLALLIPKASGYCLMQIFVMWIVVQGVGAADKIWDAALDYLNRGGVIIQAEVKNPLGDRNNPKTLAIPQGAGAILAGQVCMAGLQRLLDNQRKSYLQAKQKDVGPCSGSPTGPMKTFCTSAVPDFIGTVNVISTQNDKAPDNLGMYSTKMPNFSASSPYSSLNGVCGEIQWNAFKQEELDLMGSLAANQLDTIKISRAIAVQQMYSELSSIARVMVNNDPGMSLKAASPDTDHFSKVAVQQYGVPYTAAQNRCEKSNDQCVSWGQAQNTDSPVLFRGTEFLGAISDYNGVMRPAMNLLQSAFDQRRSRAKRDFISKAENEGWIMAGSYFFDLVYLNNAAAEEPDRWDMDFSSGLDSSSFNVSNLTSSFGSAGSCVGPYQLICTWFDKKPEKLNQLVTLINGQGLRQNPISIPNRQAGLLGSDSFETISGKASSTAYGFITNSLAMKTPGQPGAKPEFKFQFADLIKIKVDTGKYTMPTQQFDCGEVRIWSFKFCLGSLIGETLYNQIFLTIYNFFLSMVTDYINPLITAFVVLPLQGMSEIFRQGLTTLSTPGINPIVALATMGTTYINFSAQLSMTVLSMGIVTALIPIFGTFILAFLFIAMPLMFAWVGIMLSVGFITAYYIPLLPYLLFTFGTIAWLMAVIEAMVAGPIVALGVTHPEGHEAFGKGEPAIMILMNVFLRPSMMIMGYIAGIILTYVGVWILNTGFEHAVSFIQPSTDEKVQKFGGIYTGWAAVYAFFFAILAYTTTYLIIAQKSFSLITSLPDKVLRWLGSAGESAGQEVAQWGEEGKGKITEAGKDTAGAQSQTDKKVAGAFGSAGASAQSAISSGTGGGGEVSAQGSSDAGVDATPPPEESEAGGADTEGGGAAAGEEVAEAAVLL